MKPIQFALAALTFVIAGCAGMEDPFEGLNRDMTPLDGVSERPNIKNRFPESRGGLPLSRSDKEDRDMTTIERLKQY